VTTPTVQPVYGSYTTLTKTLASLATSATFVGGHELPVITNTSLFDDIQIAGFIAVGTTPTINTQILVYVFETLDDTPTYPDVFAGADAAKTLTSAGVGQGFLKLGAVLTVDATTSNRSYPFSFWLAQFFGGNLPKNVGSFVTHNSGVNLNATEGNHVVKWRGANWAIPSV
jgi:hypothetical protein